MDRTSSMPSLSSVCYWIRVRAFDLEFCLEPVLYYRQKIETRVKSKYSDLLKWIMLLQYEILEKLVTYIIFFLLMSCANDQLFTPYQLLPGPGLRS